MSAKDKPIVRTLIRYSKCVPLLCVINALKLFFTPIERERKKFIIIIIGFSIFFLITFQKERQGGGVRSAVSV